MTTTPLTEPEISALLQQGEPSTYAEKAIAEGHVLRPAAVLIPMLFYEGEWHVLFTRRADKVEHHKGQVSFPGGATDPGDDSPEATALREAQEEIGIRPQDVRILGRIAPMITISDFIVTPVVGVIPWPYAFKVHTLEVGRVFTIPLAWLADRQHFMKLVREETGRHVITYLPYDGELLWGATAHMTVEFLKVIRLL